MLKNILQSLLNKDCKDTNVFNLNGYKSFRDNCLSALVFYSGCQGLGEILEAAIRRVSVDRELQGLFLNALKHLLHEKPMFVTQGECSTARGAT